MKKFAVIIGASAIVFIMVAQLMGNKPHRDNELMAMQQYSSTVPVEIVKSRRVQAKKTVEENGVLRAGAEISVLSETSGKVLSVSVEVGDRVSAGQILARVEKEVIESQYILAKTNLDNTEKDMARYRTLAGGDAVTQQQLEASTMAFYNARTNFTALKKQLENTNIRSPITGTVAGRSIEKGASLLSAMPLFSIIEQDRMVFTVKMTETDLPKVRNGQTAAIRFDAIPDTGITGVVRSVGVIPDQSGRYDVEVDVINSNRRLRAGMSGKAAFETILQDSALVIPRKCIVGSIKDATVFVQNGDSVAARAISVETLNETDALILNGLSVHEHVVVSGQINLHDGSKVKVIN